ncbi:low-density lipoprotein receptor-like [Penaeus monodon]|uniref:low-density lipoprotein receptor-like n=1 Tax=Penaeus monodon TaxID=6687 RepID=UPI0018A7DABB|nr:low-density lipoprotein receptor-like [Penaeus monodon]
MVANGDRSRDRCIAPHYICDGRNDCQNGEYLSDEYGCGEKECLEDPAEGRKGWFRCRDGRCLPRRLLCDFNPDCKDGEDELDCGKCRGRSVSKGKGGR